MGRPSTYTPEKAAEICGRLIAGKDGRPRSLRSVCRDEDMPDASTVFLWLTQQEEFAKQYARACEARADADAEDIREIADRPRVGVIRKLERQFVPAEPHSAAATIDPDGFADGAQPDGEFRMVVVEERQQDMLEHRKLQIDTRKWLMERMRSKKYAPRAQIDHGVTGTLEQLVVQATQAALPAPPAAAAANTEGEDE